MFKFESSRIAWAFGVQGEVWFNANEVLVNGDDGSYGVWVPLKNGLWLWCDMSDGKPYYCVGTEPNENESGWCFTDDGIYELAETHPETINALCAGFYHLGILTPYVESRLGVCISNHQKLEWTLEAFQCPMKP